MTVPTDPEPTGRSPLEVRQWKRMTNAIVDLQTYSVEFADGSRFQEQVYGGDSRLIRIISVAGEDFLSVQGRLFPNTAVARHGWIVPRD